MDKEDKPIEMKCSLEKDGTITCNIPKAKFDDLQKENVQVKKVIFEIDYTSKQKTS